MFFLKSEQNEKYVFSNNGNNLLQQHANGTERLLTAVNLELQVDSEPPFQSTPTHSISGQFCSISALLSALCTCSAVSRKNPAPRWVRHHLHIVPYSWIQYDTLGLYTLGMEELYAKLNANDAHWF